LGIDGLSDDIDEIEEAVGHGPQRPLSADVDMDMKSALDRLMDDVAGAGSRSRQEDSLVTDDESEQILNPSGIRRAATEPTLLTNNFPSRDVSDESIPPPPPPKEDNNIKSRERMIIERRREARRIEEEQEDLFYGRSPTPAAIPSPSLEPPSGRPQRRRSMSTGDVNDKPLEILPSPSQEDTDDAFEESVRKELEGRKKVTERRSVSVFYAFQAYILIHRYFRTTSFVLTAPYMRHLPGIRSNTSRALEMLILGRSLGRQ
jgi:hypothetical protein